MTVEVLAALFAVSLVGGLLLVRWRESRRLRHLTASRLERWLSGNVNAAQAAPVLTGEIHDPAGQLAFLHAWLAPFDRRLSEAGLSLPAGELFALCGTLLVVPPLVAFVFDLDLVAAVALGVVAALAPPVWLRVESARRRAKFCEQLPDVIDLMVSVLRSGHSVPQAVKTVADEMSDPVGAEFAQVVQRMNLGQPFSEALAYTCVRYRSFELDLIRRAVTVQAEVGGSLAELLDKTNQTLRGRLKLVRQVSVLTAQSRLTAVIVGLMPIVLALALEHMSPGYLEPLTGTDSGRLLLAAAIVLEVAGLLVMRRLSAVRV